jgi:hypothetical protein
LLSTFLFVGDPESRASGYEYFVPEKMNDGWQTATLNDVKLDAGLITEMFDRIGDNTYKNISSVVIVKNGKLVIEEYFPRVPYLGDRNRAIKRVSPLQLYSATKSVTSILIGIAIDRGLIHGVDEKISAFFPEYAEVFTNKDKAQLRLKDFLSMSAGMAWDEWSYAYTDTVLVAGRRWIWVSVVAGGNKSRWPGHSVLRRERARRAIYSCFSGGANGCGIHRSQRQHFDEPTAGDVAAVHPACNARATGWD